MPCHLTIQSTQRIAIDMPCDINLNNLNQLFNGQSLSARLQVQLPADTPLLDLHLFATREGLVLTYSDKQLQFIRPKRPGLLQRARNFITQPQSF